MNLIRILDCCPNADLYSILGIVQWVIKLICWVVPIIIIILTILDVAKIVTAGNIDDKLKKEVTSKITTRIIFAVLIFLVPTIVKLLFGFIPVVKDKTNNTEAIGATWQTCWDATEACK